MAEDAIKLWKSEENMRELTHLEQLEAEAIYIMREVAAECEKRDAAFGIEGFLPGKTAFPLYAY